MTFAALTTVFRKPWTIWIGLRYLRSKRSSRFLGMITWISILGVLIGVTAMIVVLSVMDGFEGQLKQRLFSSDVHVLIQPTKQLPEFSEGRVPSGHLPEIWRTRFQKENHLIKAFWPVLSTESILKSSRTISGVVVKGVETEQAQAIKMKFVETAEPQLLVKHEGVETIRLPTVWVGQELANEMGLIPGDEVTLISPTETEGPLSSVPRVKKFIIEAIYRSGYVDQELHTVFTPIQNVKSFLRIQDGISAWELTLNDPEVASDLSKTLKRELAGYKIQDWIEMNGHLFASLKLERLSMFIILVFIVIVASFNIVSILSLLVLEKKKEISILKSLGAENADVAAIFLSQGLLIGGFGVLMGLGLGGVLCLILRRYEIIELPDIYYDRTLPVTFNPSYYFWVSVSAFAIVIIASLYPSQKAGKLTPMEGIRLG